MRFAFELSKAVATLVNLNTRVEKAGAGGKDKTPACDLRISTAQSPDVLAFFEPTLKQHLFNDAGPRDLADGLPLRDPHLVYPLKRDEEMTGARVSIDYGVSETIDLEDCKLKDFAITPMQGGTVIVAFTVQCKPDAFKDLPYLYQLQEQGITLSVTPAELPTMAEAAA
jgi:hypothetical protein